MFDWYMNIKHNREFNSNAQDYIQRSEDLVKEIHEQLYYFIPKILANLEGDREQLRQLT